MAQAAQQVISALQQRDKATHIHDDSTTSAPSRSSWRSRGLVALVIVVNMVALSSVIMSWFPTGHSLGQYKEVVVADEGGGIGGDSHDSRQGMSELYNTPGVEVEQD